VPVVLRKEENWWKGLLVRLAGFAKGRRRSAGGENPATSDTTVTILEGKRRREKRKFGRLGRTSCNLIARGMTKRGVSVARVVGGKRGLIRRGRKSRG